MENKYVHFISDEHLLVCIGNVHKAYLKEKNNITKRALEKIKPNFPSANENFDYVENRKLLK